MGKIVEKIIDGVPTPVDEYDWENDEQGVIDRVMENRRKAELASSEGSSEEVAQLLDENELEGQDFDPSDFGDERIDTPPTGDDD